MAKHRTRKFFKIFSSTALVGKETAVIGKNDDR